jgi:hypothetical protein
VKVPLAWGKIVTLPICRVVVDCLLSRDVAQDRFCKGGSTLVAQAVKSGSSVPSFAYGIWSNTWTHHQGSVET